MNKSHCEVGKQSHLPWPLWQRICILLIIILLRFSKCSSSLAGPPFYLQNSVYLRIQSVMEKLKYLRASLQRRKSVICRCEGEGVVYRDSRPIRASPGPHSYFALLIGCHGEVLNKQWNENRWLQIWNTITSFPALPWAHQTKPYGHGSYDL